MNKQLSVDLRISTHRKYFSTYWRNKGNWYWYWRALQEFIELGLSLLGLHKDKPEVEKTEIAGIMANWMEYRGEIPPSPKEGKEEKI